jgi:hypothetical protein
MLSTLAQSCAQRLLTTHLSFAFQELTLSKVHAHISSAAQTDRCTHPTLRQVVSTWTLSGGRLAPRRANEGYTAEPTTLARLVCQAYHRHPGRTTCRPPASTRSLQMPTEQGLSTQATTVCFAPCASLARARVRWPTTPLPVKRHSHCVPPFLPLLWLLLWSSQLSAGSSCDNSCR